MGKKNFLRLVSEIIRLASCYEVGEVEEAQRYVGRSFSGSEAERFSQVLSGIKGMASARKSAAISRKALLESSVNLREPWERLSFESELRAILLDDQFLPSKRDVVELAQRVLRLKVPPKIASKSSRSALASWIVNQIKVYGPTEIDNVFATLRQLYMKNRGSSLSGWSEIISSKK